MLTQERFNLNGVNVFAAAYDNILFAVNQGDKSILVFYSHIAGIEPVAFKDFVGSIGIFIIAFHNAGALNAELADLSLRNLFIVFIHNFGFPHIAGYADGADFFRVFYAKVNTAGPKGF